MANWAIVIGVDRYAIQDAALGGAVRDALDVREWLLDPQGGDVPEANLALVLGPAEGAPDPGVQAAAPDRNSATKAVAELIQRSGGAGERLYFYFSGHGISARTGFSDEDAMLFSDFEWLLPDNSWSLRSLSEYFATFQFQDQIMFVDACRNAPRIQEVRIGHWPRRASATSAHPRPSSSSSTPRHLDSAPPRGARQATSTPRSRACS